MSHFLGIFPDEKASYQLRKLLANYGRLFDAQGVPITLVRPEQFHMTLVYFGQQLGFVRREALAWKLRRYPFKPLTIGLDRVRLGISRNYKELLFASVNSGADTLRETVFDLSRKLGVRDDKVFIPHITLGRVSKDLMDQEYNNLNEDIQRINRELFTEEITITPQYFDLIHSKDGEYKRLKRFLVS